MDSVYVAKNKLYFCIIIEMLFNGTENYSVVIIHNIINSDFVLKIVEQIISKYLNNINNIRYYTLSYDGLIFQYEDRPIPKYIIIIESITLSMTNFVMIYFLMKLILGKIINIYYLGHFSILLLFIYILNLPKNKPINRRLCFLIIIFPKINQFQ